MGKRMTSWISCNLAPLVSSVGLTLDVVGVAMLAYGVLTPVISADDWVVKPGITRYRAGDHARYKEESAIRAKRWG